MKRNFILFLSLIVVSMFVAYPIGYFIDHIVFPYTYIGGFGDVGWGNQATVFIDGSSYSFALLLPIIFGVFGDKKKLIAMAILFPVGILMPSIIISTLMSWYFAGVDIASILLYATFFIFGLILALVINKFFIKGK